MRYKNKTKSIRVVLRLIVGLTTSLFVLSLTNALNAELVEECGKELDEYGYFELTGNLNCSETDKPAIKITGNWVWLNLNGYTLSGNEDNVCIQIEGEGARVYNGTVESCKEGIEIKPESGDNRITLIKSCNNKRRGFRIRGDKNQLSDCTATNNGRKGFSIEGEEDERANDNLLVKCLAKNNGHQGFIIEIGDGNDIYWSKAYANCRDGIEIDGGSYNQVLYNHVEDNGNKEVCDSFADDPTNPLDDYYYKPWYYAGIDIKAGSEMNPSEYNEIKYNHACGNLGCNGSDESICEARERNYWDENVNDEGNFASLNEWENNTVCPECTPGP
jgi:hypothetical protein